MKYNCLIVDDELTIAETTCEYFNMFDISSAYVTSYEACVDFLANHQVSLILLDINLGKSSGFELCKHLRKTSDIPILFISARTSDDDILTALNIGGDDYITKPFSLNILLAKVKAMLKRYENTQHTPSLSPACEHIVLDYNYRLVLVDGTPIKLKEMEFKLLSYLVEHKNTVVSKDELFDSVWQDRFIGDGTLSVHIRRLREKIEANPNDPSYIKTIWGVGYVFEVKS
ncbi:MAG: response regulator transcription factor [Cellulosilyticaceae bacterium]